MLYCPARSPTSFSSRRPGRDLLEGLSIGNGMLYTTGASFGGGLAQRGPQLPNKPGTTDIILAALRLD